MRMINLFRLMLLVMGLFSVQYVAAANESNCFAQDDCQLHTAAKTELLIKGSNYYLGVVPSAAVSHPNGKTSLFVGDKYYRFDFGKNEVDKVGRIGTDGWRGLPANINAAVKHPNGKTYFFVGNKCYRFDFFQDQVDKVGIIGTDGWRGLPSNINAAIKHPNGKTYFFVSNYYCRFDFREDQVDKIGKTGIDGCRGLLN